MKEKKNTKNNTCSYSRDFCLFENLKGGKTCLKTRKNWFCGYFFQLWGEFLSFCLFMWVCHLYVFVFYETLFFSIEYHEKIILVHIVSSRTEQNNCLKINVFCFYFFLPGVSTVSENHWRSTNVKKKLKLVLFLWFLFLSNLHFLFVFSKIHQREERKSKTAR